MEGGDRVVAVTILCPRGQHSLAAAPGLWALLCFLWVEMAFLGVEKGRTENKRPLVSALTLDAPGYGDRQSRTLGCWALPRAEGSARSLAGKKAIKQLFAPRRVVNSLLQQFDAAKCIYQAKDLQQQRPATI